MNTALIDADILVYESAYRAQHAFEWEPGVYSKHADIEDAKVDFAACIEGILDATDSNVAVLALTDSDRALNFRRSVWPAYKQHRAHKTGEEDDRPILYGALREWIRGQYTIRQIPGIEGDDALGILATGRINGLPKRRDERIICSVDKDMLTIPGRHYNWRKAELGVRVVDGRTADWNFMFQVLTGDSTDGFPGLPGCGPVGAKKILRGLRKKSRAVKWAAVVEAYRIKGLTEADALVQARCARILRASDWDFENRRPVLWAPPEQWEEAA